MVELQDSPVRSPFVSAQAAEIGQWLRSQLADGATLCCDSRAVRAGDAFFAMPGLRTDGRKFIDQAIARGAAAVIVEQSEGQAPETGAVPCRQIKGLAAQAGQIASQFHGRPSEQLQVVAVTGTNGKTSVSQWIAQGLAARGQQTAVIGTLGCGPVDALEAGSYTTPDALQTQALLADFAVRGIDTVSMEASSIGLHQGRVNGTRIPVAVYTNLSRDHLDYHDSMDEYAASKALLFGWPGLQSVVINGDDEFSPRMLAAAVAGAGDTLPLRIVYGFAPSQFGARGDAVLLAERMEQTDDGVSFVLSGDYGRSEVRLSLLGAFNVSNVLAVAGCWLAMGVSFDQVVGQLEQLRAVPGRLQMIRRPGAPLAVVDYAHTPDALSNVLSALRPVADARGGALWCLFGAGGDRDPGKRPLMGMVAEGAADQLVITSDNPRSETPFRIVSDIRAGLTREPRLTELDRGAAIEAALRLAAPADVVLIAGKGHELYQEIATGRQPFSDVAIAGQALDRRLQEHADV
jgi:UDP-N-acetylmuramoyl-L-alanyl-D-glutamate--2,6-diaminopimelate ligase